VRNATEPAWEQPAQPDGKPLQASAPGRQQKRVRELLKLPADFVLPSPRRTFGTGESGRGCLYEHARYVHPPPEAVELAFGRLMALNLAEVGAKPGTPDQTDNTPEIQ
jgi:hypothetical protein